MRSLPEAMPVSNPGPVGAVRWWYHLAALPKPPLSAPFAARERTRRTRLIAVFLLALIAIKAGLLPLTGKGRSRCLHLFPSSQ